MQMVGEKQLEISVHISHLNGAKWKLLSLVLLIWSALLAIAAPVQAQSFRIEKINFCYNEVRQVSSTCVPVDGTLQDLDRTKFATSNIYLIVSIVGEESALNFLKQTYTLPVIASYFRNGDRFDISTGIGQDDWNDNASALTNLVQTQGSFSWRTRFCIGISNTRSIELQIVDARKNIVYIGHQPARFTISFSN